MSEPIAVVGLSCVFPGAPDLATYWDNIVRGVDAITDVPPERWDPLFYDPSVSAVDRFYCRRGGFVDAYARFDPLKYGVMPVAARGAEPEQLLTLEVAARALEDAAAVGDRLPKARTAVILGRGNYIGAGQTRLEQHVRTANQLVVSLRTLLPDLSEAELAGVKADFQSRLGVYGADTAIGLVPNLTASRVANRLDLSGPAYTVDAACASALVAIDQACLELRSGRVDLALAGGVHLTHDVGFWSVFTQLGALSRTGCIRPFDAHADGLLIGEGVGVVALKRASDAQRDGDRVYCVVRGTGVASDGRTSLMSPESSGQALAVRRAWADAGLDPATVGLIEAHGTATAAGDSAELQTLLQVFGADVELALGSVKSMIGHAMPAAGAAGFIKAALAVYHGVLPPSLHCETPHPVIADSAFRVPATAEPWATDGPRRAGVNAFGFGGINAHIVLESTAPRPAPGAAISRPEALLLIAAADADALVAALESGQTGGTGPCRLALVDPTPERRVKARETIRRGTPRRGRDGSWFSPGGLVHDGGRVAFLFPGVEGVFQPRLEGLPAELRAAVQGLAGPTALERQGAGVLMLGWRLHEMLAGLGVHPAAVAGHSVGEWTAMIAGEMLGGADLDALLSTLEPGTLEVPDVAFASVGCGVDRIAELLPDLDVVVSLDNCPRQVVLCGPEAQVEVALARLSAARVLAQMLPFRSGFHTPALEGHLAPHRDRVEGIEFHRPQVPVWSATRAAPFPDDPDAARALTIEHLVRPVRFREMIEAMYADGVRAFVQLGTGSLVGFVSDTLRGRPHLAISANAPQRSGRDQLRRAVAALFVEGVDVDQGALAAMVERPGGMQLQLGVPLIRIEHTLAPRSAPAPERAGLPGAVGAAFDAVLREVQAAQGAVAEVFDEAPTVQAPSERVTRRTLSVDTCPWLIDHSLFPQPPGWPELEDRYPVVPMTMSVQMVLQAARDVAPDRIAVAVEDIRAYKWLAVAPPVEAEIVARREGDVVTVEIKGALRARVRLAARWPEPPAVDLGPLPDEVPPPVTAAQLYAEGYMFHGPAYQGVTTLHADSPAGMRGQLTTGAAEGSLLDCAGQLLGFWIMHHTTEDRLAMPVKVGRFEFFGPDPEPGTPVECVVRVGRIGRREALADLDLCIDGRLWCRITGWEDWRFETDDRLWPVIRQAERHLLGEVTEAGWVRVLPKSRTQRSWEYLRGRFLSKGERAEMDAMAQPRRRDWLMGRIAAKDATRAWLRARGRDRVFPVEIRVTSDADGRPHLAGDFGADLRISIAHSGGRAVALVAEGHDPGIDLEAIEARSPTLVRTAFHDDELERIGDRPRAEWLTRLWCAKEAVAKARGGGLGSPRKWRLSAIDGQRLRVDGLWVETCVDEGFVVAWTTA